MNKGQVTEHMKKEWDKMVDFIIDNGELSEWESSFIDSMSIRRSDGKDLSFKMSSKLRELYNREQQRVG